MVAVGDGERARVVDAAAVVSADKASCDPETNKFGLDAGIHREDAGNRATQALLRATVRLAAPGPSMSIKPVVLLRSGRAELSVIVPVTEKLMVLSPGVLSAWVMT